MMLFQKNSLVMKSYAKINLSLRVLGKRDDGYHELEMVNLPLDLHDVIEIEKQPDASDTFITCDDIGLANARHNLCTKAVDAMRKEFGFKDNFTIAIHKEIPFAAGLGGGSSNAAVVIQALVSLLHIKTTPEVLNRIGQSLGADVPFFFLNHPALVTGIGEKMEAIPVKKSYNALIVKPKEGLSTTDVFAVCDKFERSPIDTASVRKALASGDNALLASSIGNDLYLPAKSLLPKVEDVVTSLKKDGFSIVSMTGSGSCVFALSDDAKKIKDCAKKYEHAGYVVRVTKTLQ
jgi:4-diphosphocytidyl-2-C-methyl-D-erythritol kinase